MVTIINMNPTVVDGLIIEKNSRRGTTSGKECLSISCRRRKIVYALDFWQSSKKDTISKFVQRSCRSQLCFLGCKETYKRAHS